MIRTCAAALAVALPMAVSGWGATVPEATFTGGVAKVFWKRCEVCHRPGEAAQFSLLTYEDVACQQEDNPGYDELRTKFLQPYDRGNCNSMMQADSHGRIGEGPC